MTKGKPSNIAPCCTCNGNAARCKGCRCAKNKTACVNCRAACCQNTCPNMMSMKLDSVPLGNLNCHLSTVDTSNEPVVVGQRRENLNYDNLIEDMYMTVISWVPNHMKLPKCSTSGQFINLLTEKFNAVAIPSLHEQRALKEVVVMSQLMLQSIPSRGIGTIRKALLRRMDDWNLGKYKELFDEASILQRRMVSDGFAKGFQRISKQKKFSRFMRAGKTSAAIKILEDTEDGNTVYSFDDMCDGKLVSDILTELHPPAQPLSQDAVLSLPITNCKSHHFSIYSGIDGRAIIRESLRTHGGAGPSGITAIAFRRMLTAFGSHSIKLADAIAGLAVRIASESIPAESLQAYVNSRIVALNKRPGVRPIGVGEVFRRVIGKAILNVAKRDLRAVAGNLQMCAGQPGGLGYVIHTLTDHFHSDEQYGILSVDAKNAFNLMNRCLMLKNVEKVCPAFTCVLRNIYKLNALLVGQGGNLASSEGVTQGDPLEMPAFAISSMPLIYKIRESIPSIKQCWYADDSTFVGGLDDLSRVWRLLCSIGEQYGYHVNPNKSRLLIHPRNMIRAQHIFGADGLIINEDGLKVLGAPIGTPKFVREYCCGQFLSMSNLVKDVANAADADAHSAFVAYSLAVQSKWTHLFRAVDCDIEWLDDLKNVIDTKFMNSMFGDDIDLDLRGVCSLSTSLGGLGIRNIESELTRQYNAARLLSSIYEEPDLDIGFSVIHLLSAIQNEHKEENRNYAEKLKPEIIPILRKSVEYASLKGASNWLTRDALVSTDCQLSTQEFRDALSVRYGLTPKDLPDKCQCGQILTTSHALSCKRGAFNFIRHNQLRDFLVKKLNTVCWNVFAEPSLTPVPENISFNISTTTRQDDARADIVGNGLFGGNMERTFFDVVVFNNHAPSYCEKSTDATFTFHENRKCAKYEERIHTIEHSSFCPLIWATTGGAGKSAQACIKSLALKIAEQQKSEYAVTISSIRTYISMCLAKICSATLRCPRVQFQRTSYLRAGLVLSE